MRPSFIERFSGLQGEKGEPGAVLTGDVPLERLRGQKVIIPPDPESTCLLKISSLFLLLTMFFRVTGLCLPVLG